jgi:hypothetical protein
MWVNGLPGAGKSCIANTLVKRLVNKGRRVIYFRFDQNSRSDATAKVLWRSVAYQLADQFAEPRQVILTALRDDTTMSNLELLTSQDIFDLLIAKALKPSASVPPDCAPIVIIDALDECSGDSEASAVRRRADLLHAIRKWTETLPHCKLLVTSRGEMDIGRALSQISKQVVLYAGEDVDDESEVDIRRYILQRLKNIAEGEPLLATGWPTTANVERLAKRSAGLFVWAKTACDFVEDGIASERLAELLDPSNNVTGLKGLYSMTLERAFSGCSKTELAVVRVITGTIIALATPLSLEAMTAIINASDENTVLTAEQASFVRNRLSSVLIGGAVPKYAHLSFPEFLQSIECPEKFRIDVKMEHRRLALGTLNTLNQLRFNICNLENSHVLNDDVLELFKRVEAAVPTHLSYSCQFWTVHLLQATYDSSLSTAAWHFLHRRSIFWLETMSLIKGAGKASQMLYSLASWSSVRLPLRYWCNAPLIIETIAGT